MNNTFTNQLQNNVEFSFNLCYNSIRKREREKKNLKLGQRNYERKFINDLQNNVELNANLCYNNYRKKERNGFQRNPKGE